MTEQENVEDLNVIATFKPEDYWEWRTSVEECDHAQTQHNLAGLKLRLMEANNKMQMMEMALFKNNMKTAADNLDLVKKDYKKYLKGLEDKYNISMDSVTIRPDMKVVKLSENSGG